MAPAGAQNAEHFVAWRRGQAVDAEVSSRPKDMSQNRERGHVTIHVTVGAWTYISAKALTRAFSER